MNIAILILAAGASSRMGGRDKLLEPIGGTTLLRTVCERAIETGYPVGVTLSDLNAERATELFGLEPLRRIHVPDANLGMSGSIRAGVSTFSDNDAIMVLPADMPDITAQDLMAMINLYVRAPSKTILRATDADGTPGHPVIFPHDLFSDLCQLTGDIGARSVLKRHSCRIISHALSGKKATTDLDTPQDWDAWRINSN